MGSKLQKRNGSPEYPGKHVQVGKCEMTWHSAFSAQLPGHASLHFDAIQAKFGGQSLFLMHSGLQLT